MLFLRFGRDICLGPWPGNEDRNSKKYVLFKPFLRKSFKAVVLFILGPLDKHYSSVTIRRHGGTFIVD